MVRSYFLILYIVISFAAISDAQQPAIDSSSAPPTEAPTPPKQVDVQPVARDHEIAKRLGNILDATEWFTAAEVEVKEGVVFLRGVALDSEYRSWATNLAKNTQDVAAVVNRMSLRQRPIWDFSPAFNELRNLTANAIQMSPLALFAFVVVASTWFLALAFKRFISWSLQRRLSNGILRGVAAQVSMLPILLIGLYVVLRVSGLTQLALTVLGGTGLAGLIIGIAFRDIAENFLASILISVQNPFRTGDLIQVSDQLGFVQRVSTRGTLLMTRDGNHVQIPNSIIYKSVVTNFTANPNRRVEFTVGIGYDDSISQAQSIIKQVLDEHPSVLSDPESRVVLDELGAATVNLRVLFWLDGSKHPPEVIRSSVMRQVKQSLLTEGISLPDEAREIIFPQQVPVRIIQQNEQPDQSASKRHDRYGAPDLPTATKALAARNLENEPLVSPGEGTLKSDAEDIQRQADKSWVAEDGENLLREENPSKSDMAEHV